MKIENEIKALRGLRQCSEKKELLIKNSNINSVLFLLIGLAILLFLYFFVVKDGKFSTYFLFVASGVFITMAYVKYSEKVGFELLARYIDLEKINARMSELNIEHDEKEPKIESPIKKLIHLAIWLTVGFVCTFIYRTYL